MRCPNCGEYLNPVDYNDYFLTRNYSCEICNSDFTIIFHKVQDVTTEEHMKKLRKSIENKLKKLGES